MLKNFNAVCSRHFITVHARPLPCYQERWETGRRARVPPRDAASSMHEHTHVHIHRRLEATRRQAATKHLLLQICHHSGSGGTFCFWNIHEFSGQRRMELRNGSNRPFWSSNAVVQSRLITCRDLYTWIYQFCSANNFQNLSKGAWARPLIYGRDCSEAPKTVERKCLRPMG